MALIAPISFPRSTEAKLACWSNPMTLDPDASVRPTGEDAYATTPWNTLDFIRSHSAQLSANVLQTVALTPLQIRKTVVLTPLQIRKEMVLTPLQRRGR